MALFVLLALAQIGGNTCCATTNVAASRSETGEALVTARLFETGPNGSWNTNLFRLHFASDAFRSRALAQWVPVREVPVDFLSGIEEACHEHLLEAWQTAESVRLLRHAQKEDGLHCQYRLILRSGQLGYWTLLFGRPGGRTGIIDAQDHSSGVWFRHVAEGAYFMGLTDSKAPAKLPAPRGSGLTPKSAADLLEFFGLTFDKKWSHALQVYPRLPPSVQSKEFVRIAYATCLSDRSDAKEKEILEELTPFLSGNLVQELCALNTAYQEKSLYALMAAAREIKEKNGADAYLDVMQARVHRYLGALADAEAEAIRAVQAEPTLAQAHELLIDLALKSGDYATVARRIRHQEQIFGNDLSHLAEQEKFADFARSAPGRDWFSSHGKSTNSQPDNARSNSGVVSNRRHRLQGIFLSNARPTALIDGRTVEKGDRLPGGYVVQSITNMSVTLVDNSGEATVLRVK